MNKIAIYFVPGLAASPDIFENLRFSKDKYELHFLEWKIPLTIDEPISHYAKRMCKDIKSKLPIVLIGVSFGGIIVQEMSMFLNTKKVIIISSVKHHKEFPKRFQVAKFTKIYKFFPTKIAINFEDYAHFFLGKPLQKRADLYKKYLSVRNKRYLKWAINNVILWKQKNNVQNIIHIHGTKDKVFPSKNIPNFIEIKGGNHTMIITKAKKIATIIDTALV